MLSLDEQQKIRDVLAQLNVRTDINMAFFLNKIIDNNTKIDDLESKMNTIIRNQKVILKALR